MKKILLLMVVATLFACESHNAADPTTIAWNKVAAIPHPGGLSATFAGLDGKDLIVAGGCNFSNTSAAMGGKKVFSDKIYQFKNLVWELHDITLPRAAAYGVSVSLPEGIYLIGGTADGRQSLKSTLFYKSGKITTLPDLPLGMDNMGGGALGSDIYVAGGLNDGTPTNRVFVLDGHTKEWSEIEPYPGEARVQPVVAVQNAAEESRLYIIGGFNPQSRNVMLDGWAYSPSEKKWLSVSPAPVGLNGGVAFASGVHTILATGGVNKERFTEGLNTTTDSARLIYMTHQPEWYNFNKTLYAYNTIVDRWCSTGELPIARAGATVAADGVGWYLVAGETMPGIRTDEIWHGVIVSDRTFGWINWSVIVVYLAAMIGMGLFFMLRAKNTDDFFRASGRVPWWAVSVSIFATMLSAITFMAIPAKTFATDWRYFLSAITIFMVAFPVVKYYLPFFRRLNITSAYEYLELRFNKTLRTISSIIFIIFMTARMALVLYLPSLALTAATGIDVYTCILLMSLITIIYSSIGGIEAVIWGDVVQGIILMGGAIFTLIFLITHTDGNFLQIAIDNDKFHIFNFAFDFTSATFWVMIIGGMAVQLISYTSDQTVIQRYMTVKNEKQAGKSIITNGILSLISSALFYTIGTALFAYFQSRPETLDIAMPTADSIFPFFIMSQLPVGLAGILIAAIFAASMSTVSSNINSIATAFTVDIYSKLVNNPTEKQRMQSARLSSVVFGMLGCGFALMMATWNILSLFDWFNTMLGLLTSGLGALFFMGIFFDRIDGRSALIGFITGTALLLVVTIQTNISFWMYGFIGMALITIVSLIMSYILPDNSRKLNGLTWKWLNSKQ